MPSPTFDKQTTAGEVIEAFQDQVRGKHVLITGTSPKSLGEAAAVAVAKGKPALLILASRTPSKLEAVAKLVRETLGESSATSLSPAPLSDGQGNTKTVVATVLLDLASQASVRQAAKDIAALTDSLDVLINNAGVSLHTRQTSPEGIELTFATNHLGPFLLTTLLLPLLQKGATQSAILGSTRVINVTSSGHAICPIRFSDLNFEGKPIPAEERHSEKLPGWIVEEVDGYPGVLAYAMSKCANVLFTVALRERLLEEYGIDSFTSDPGLASSNLERDIGHGFKDWLQTVKDQYRSNDQGCASSLVAAFDPSLSGSGAIMLGADCQVEKPAPHAVDKQSAERLWTVGEQLTKVLAKEGKL